MLRIEYEGFSVYEEIHTDEDKYAFNLLKVKVRKLLAKDISNADQLTDMKNRRTLLIELMIKFYRDNILDSRVKKRI